MNIIIFVNKKKILTKLKKTDRTIIHNLANRHVYMSKYLRNRYLLF